MKHWSQVQALVRAGRSHGDLRRPLRELKLALESEAEADADPATLEQAAWVERQLREMDGKRHPDAPTEATEAEARRQAYLDPVQALVRRKALRPYELAACRRLASIWEALSCGLVLPARPLDAVRVDGGFKRTPDPMGSLTVLEGLEVRFVYRPWAARMEKLDAGVGFVTRRRGRRERPWWWLTFGEYAAIYTSGGTMDARLPMHLEPNCWLPEYRPPQVPERERAQRAIGLTCFDLVRFVVMDRRSLKSLCRQYCVRDGTLTAPLVTALRAYMDIRAEVVEAGLLEEPEEHGADHA